MVQLPPVPATSMVVLKWLYWAKPMRTVLHYQLEDLSGAPGASILGPRLVAAFNTAALAGIGQSANLMEIDVTPLDVANSAAQPYSTGLPKQGTYSGPNMPNESSCLISWQTNKRGKSYRGRSYIPGPVQNPANPNALVPAQATALQTLANNLITLTGSPNAKLCIVSYFHNKAMRQVPEVNWVTNGIVRTALATQRRRQP